MRNWGRRMNGACIGCGIELEEWELCVGFCEGCGESEMETKTTPKYNPPRQLGRVDGATWDRLRAAAERAGMTFTTWAVAILLKEAAKSERNR